MRAALIALVTLAAVGCEQAARTTGPQEVPGPLASYHDSPAAVQIVFSGQTPPGTFVPDSDPVPFGFWVWCEDEDAGNLYAGACAGSIYFYALGLVRAVGGTVEEDSPGIFTMSLASSDGDIVCKLTNADASLNKGPRNDVEVDCDEPDIDGTFEGAVVVVTGP